MKRIAQTFVIVFAALSADSQKQEFLETNYIGILLPPSAPGFLANMALALDRRVAVNLNYTASSDVMNACIKDAGTKHVLTSRRVMAVISRFSLAVAWS